MFSHVLVVDAERDTRRDVGRAKMKGLEMEGGWGRSDFTPENLDLTPNSNH